jgi:hypothetical protein
MKHAHSTPSVPTGEKARQSHRCEEAVRRCEQLAARVKSTSEELTACWTALGIEIATGATRTDLLKRRAWCNVIELRLREQTAELEEARHTVDAVWKSLMSTARKHELNHRHQPKNAAENLFSKTWTLLLQPKTTATGPMAVAAKE